MRQPSQMIKLPLRVVKMTAKMKPPTKKMTKVSLHQPLKRMSSNQRRKITVRFPVSHMPMRSTPNPREPRRTRPRTTGLSLVEDILKSGKSSIISERPSLAENVSSRCSSSNSERRLVDFSESNLHLPRR